MKKWQNKTQYRLPRGYLSYSQMIKWLNSRDKYIEEYFYNGKKLNTRHLEFGKQVARKCEDSSILEQIPGLPLYKHREYDCSADVMGVRCYGFIDDYDDVKNVFRDKKTSVDPKYWNDIRVQKLEQLVFYATCLYHISGRMPEYCHIDWLETIDEKTPIGNDSFWNQFTKGELKLTGNFKSFKRTFTRDEILRMERKIMFVAEAISKAYTEHLNNLF